MSNQAQTVATESENELLARLADQEYRLLPRCVVGCKSHYRLTTVQHHLDEGHSILRRIRTSGDFERCTMAVRPDGAGVEQITWKAFSVAEGKGRAGTWAPAIHLPESSDFSYQFCAEDSYEAFHWSYNALPKTALGDSFMLHTVNAHFEFDFLRSRHHGAIEKLRRIGDSLVIPDNDRQFVLRLRAAPLAWFCTKRDFNVEFVGLSFAAGQLAGIVAFSSWLDVLTHAGHNEKNTESPGNTQFAGHLYVDLSDNSILHADFDEWVCLPALVPNGPLYSRFFVQYRIHRISEQQVSARVDDQHCSIGQPY